MFIWGGIADICFIIHIMLKKKKKKKGRRIKKWRVSIISFRSDLILDTEQFYPMVCRELHQHNCAADQRLLQVGNTNSFHTNTQLFFLPLQTGRTGKTLPWWQQKGSPRHLLRPTALIQHRTSELHSCSQAVRSTLEEQNSFFRPQTHPTIS